MSSLVGFFLPLVLMIAVFYFILIRPQNKERNRLQEMINNIKKGDKVVTRAGIIGRIIMINKEESTFIINSEGSQLKITQDSIVSIEIKDEIKFDEIKESSEVKKEDEA